MDIAKSLEVGMSITNKSRHELQSYLGVSSRTISSWINGHSMPEITKLSKIAKFFDNQPVSNFIAWGESNGND